MSSVVLRTTCTRLPPVRLQMTNISANWEISSTCARRAKPINADSMLSPLSMRRTIISSSLIIRAEASGYNSLKSFNDSRMALSTDLPALSDEEMADNSCLN